MARPNERYSIWRHTPSSGLEQIDDQVVSEEPLEIRVAGRPIGITMRTPGHDDELALGFLVGEGIIAHPDDVEYVRRCDKSIGESIDVIVAPRVSIDFSRLTRHVFASSSCGVCGTATIDSLRKQFPRLPGGPTIPADLFHKMAAQLRSAQPTFDTTGGLHAAALFDSCGRLVLAREDVGRHNAVDKLVGSALKQSLLPLSNHVLLVSGRASFEIVQKALAAGIPCVAAISAPSSLAIDLAAESNITLVGFLRPGRFNVYTHPQRIQSHSS